MNKYDVLGVVVEVLGPCVTWVLLTTERPPWEYLACLVSTGPHRRHVEDEVVASLR